ncbi:Asp-tRNA(Asn)/Glu-tRNA(Gln) amidotransferase subunit GatC [Oceanobacillus damuensis]|uniref:Asp-tRNA(Asn)/Glu-tRNA(Gln) amidotransferase subunit GatC n=1 Tax=Oceanobacillus damuensis TaxID=937928 RepID=UPI000831F83F|nr:Asp-tRNA(Asn)/Glu-tRNA(Gln) amidotransferase subunit GatC [Oceanobacillus damuensis]
MADISKEQVKHVAHLARLAVTDEAVEKMAKELSSIIDYAEQLNELDTDGVEPTTHVLDLKNVMRKDQPKEWITQEDALKNAPDQKDGQFRVPSILADS